MFNKFISCYFGIFHEKLTRTDAYGRAPWGGFNIATRLRLVSLVRRVRYCSESDRSHETLKSLSQDETFRGASFGVVSLRS